MQSFFGLGVLNASFWLCFSTSLWAQQGTPAEGPTRVEVLNADLLQYTKTDSGGVRALVGNVALKLVEDSTWLYCNEAFIFEETNRVEALGDVRAVVPEDTLELRSQRLKYNGRTKVLDLYTNVILTQPGRRLTTDTLVYYRTRDLGYYPNHGTLRDSANTLSSIQGWYSTATYIARFVGEVTLIGHEEGSAYVLTTDTLRYNTDTEVAFFESSTCIVTPEGEELYAEGGYADTRNNESFLHGYPSYRDSSYYLEADTIFYNDGTQLGWAKCNIQAETTDTTLFLFGDYGTFDRGRQTTEVTVAPYAIQMQDSDTLVLFADTLFSIDDSAGGQRFLSGYRNARFHARLAQGLGDSLVFNRMDSSFYLFQDPVIWRENHQITGDTLILWTRNEEPDSLGVRRNAFMATKLTKRLYNQVKGRNLFGRFWNEDLVYLRVDGNAESIYFVEEESTGQFDGMNQATATALEVFLENNEPVRIKYRNQPKGTYTPLAQALKGNLTLEGFRWRAPERPPDWIGPDAARVVPTAFAWDSLPDTLSFAPYRPDSGTLPLEVVPPNPDTLAEDTITLDSATTLLDTAATGADTTAKKPIVEQGTSRKKRRKSLRAYRKAALNGLTKEEKQVQRKKWKEEDRTAKRRKKFLRKAAKWERRDARRKAKAKKNKPENSPKAQPRPLNLDDL